MSDREGPVQVWRCEGCRFLSTYVSSLTDGKTAMECLHPEAVHTEGCGWIGLRGGRDEDRADAPSWCPLHPERKPEPWEDQHPTAPVCTTVEDVVRAAPVDGVYWATCAHPLVNDAGEIVSEEASWNAIELRIGRDGARIWWCIGWECPDDDTAYVGWRIGPRIRMPGEGA